MERYGYKITGDPTSMMMHADNIPARDAIERLRGRLKAEGKPCKPGDDRTPPSTWKHYLHHDEGYVVMPTASIQAALMKAGTDFKLAGGGRKSAKGATMSLLRFDDVALPLVLANGKNLLMKDILAIDPEDRDFDLHLQAAVDLGFILDVRSVTVGQSKHVRVRPRFSAGWSVRGTLVNMNPDLLPFDTLHRLFTNAGEMCGLGEWRPSSPKKPGPHGKFTVELQKVA